MFKVKLNVLYHCGCGFKTEFIHDAVAHCENTGHTMDGHSRIKADKPQVTVTSYPFPHPQMNRR